MIKDMNKVCLKCKSPTNIHPSKNWSICLDCNRKYQAEWRKNNKAKIRKSSTKYHRSEKGKNTIKKYVLLNKVRVNLWKVKRGQMLKMKVLSHYSEMPPYCACCKEKNMAFLTIDHMNNDGIQHRKELKMVGGINYYYWLVKNNYPKGMQVLCMNCNWGRAKNKNKICPHKI